MRTIRKEYKTTSEIKEELYVAGEEESKENDGEAVFGSGELEAVLKEELNQQEFSAFSKK